MPGFESAYDRTGADHAHARRCPANGPYAGSHVGNRSYGRLPDQSARATRKADRAQALSKRVCENLAHVVNFQAAISVARRAAVCEAPIRRLRPATPDVGHRLADPRDLDQL